MTGKSTKLAIVILNWNGVSHLRQFLPSVTRHSDGHPVYVADNGSTDDSLEVLAKEFPGVTTIKLAKNYGFAEGYNQALKKIEGQYLLLINSDVEVTEGWTRPLLQLMDTHAEVAACQPKIRSYKQRGHFEYAGAAGGFIDRYGYPFCRGRIFDTLEEDERQYDDNCEVFWATGACLLVRSDVYWELGGLDGYLFAHMEEIDLCWRIQRHGFKVAYCGSSTVYHLGGGTLPQGNPRKTFLNFRNGLILMYKNLPTSQLLPRLFIRLVLDGAAALRELLSGRVKDFYAIAKAHFAFYGYILKNGPKARSGNYSLSALRTVYHRMLILDYFIKGTKKFSGLKFKTPKL